MNHTLLALLMLACSANAGGRWDDEPSQSGYRSPSETRYRYDLRRPSDQIRYETDPGAQIRDSVSARRELDQVLYGVRGGGVLPDDYRRDRRR